LLCCTSDALDDLCQMVRDFSHALPAALGYTVNFLCSPFRQGSGPC
jgi:hypothetical protein